MNEVNNFKNAKVGDKVWCLLNGEGEIERIDDASMQIIAKFGTDVIFYKKDGRFSHSSKNPMLFREKPTVTAPEPKKRVKMEGMRWIVWYYCHRANKIRSHSDICYPTHFIESLKARNYPNETFIKTETIEREFEV